MKKVLILAALLVSPDLLPCSVGLWALMYPRDAEVGVPTNVLISAPLLVCKSAIADDGDEIQLKAYGFPSTVDVDSTAFEFRGYGYYRPVMELKSLTNYTIDCSSYVFNFQTGQGSDDTPPTAASYSDAHSQAEIPIDSAPDDGECGDGHPAAIVTVEELLDEGTPSTHLRYADFIAPGEFGTPMYPVIRNGQPTLFLSQKDWKASYVIVDGAGNTSAPVQVNVNWNGGCSCTQNDQSKPSMFWLYFLTIFCLTRRFS